MNVLNRKSFKLIRELLIKTMKKIKIEATKNAGL